MTEQLLQYIWQFQYFNTHELTTADGEPVTIVNRGIHNINQGPDFLQAAVRIGDTSWAGHVELHIKASQWGAHQHSSDPNYDNVILHVVWINDKKLPLAVPVLELQGRVSRLVLDRYQQWMNANEFIPCQESIQSVPELVWLKWKERLLVERLQEKSAIVLKCLAESNGHWEEICWWLLAKNFGIKVNSEAFEAIARSLPVNLLLKHKNQVQQLEALLLGQAGMLSGTFEDAYPKMLQREYAFLQKKYQLTPTGIPVQQLRMRPANFPAVRLAQLAMLVHRSSHLFSRFIALDDIKTIKQLLDVTANDFWHYHYTLQQSGTYKEKRAGGQLAENILVNTITPLVFAYGKYHGKPEYRDKALQWMEQLPAEKNNITKNYAALGVPVQCAFDSQALLQLKNNYCNKKRCLECAIGNKILKG